MGQDQEKRQHINPPRHQDHQPGIESEMTSHPRAVDPEYRASGKLRGKVALISGGDSGIGRAVAVVFAKEGADVSIAYLNEHKDTEETKRLVEAEERRCLLLPGDIGEEAHRQEIVARTAQELGHLNILINNAAERHPQESIEVVSTAQLERTFRTNIFAMFHLTKVALPHLKAQPGSTIVNTAPVTAYQGRQKPLDYPASQGAIVAFTRSLSQSLIEEGIRVNAVADLDAADSLHFSGGRGGHLWRRRADEAPRATSGGRQPLPLSGQ